MVKGSWARVKGTAPDVINTNPKKAPISIINVEAIIITVVLTILFSDAETRTQPNRGNANRANNRKFINLTYSYIIITNIIYIIS